MYATAPKHLAAAALLLLAGLAVVNEIARLAAVAGAAPPEGPQNCPAEGDCCVGHGTPGCADAACCDAVCRVDPFCCDIAWGFNCVRLARDLCDCVVGSCCLTPLGICTLVSQEQCAEFEGDYAGDCTLCEECPPGLGFGACCLPLGACFQTNEFSCVQGGGVYQGDGTICEKGLCAGACCVPDGPCLDTVTSPVCELCLGGVYQGDGTTCAGTCRGACCVDDGADGICFENVDQFECEFFGQTPLGEGSVCAGSGCGPDPPVGACCLSTACCLDGLTWEECEAGDGDWQGTGTTCADVTCGEGACCFVDFCNTFEAHLCELLGGTFQGIGTNCTDCDPPIPVGACCEPFGTCDAPVTEMECVQEGGVYQGDGTTCDSFICAEAVACCLPSGDCADLTAACCLGLGGEPGEPDSSCAVAPPCVTGACCFFPEGFCDEVLESFCEDSGGTYQGDGTTCDGVVCDNGACCLDEPGACVEVTSLQCGFFGGEFFDGVACAQAPCGGTTGACCLPDGTCVEQTPSECAAQAGEYQGDGTSCADVDCTTGACCLPNGTCLELTESFCTALSGDYQGDNSFCAAGLCPVGACETASGCQVVTEAYCLLIGGEFQGAGSTCVVLGSPSEFVASGEPVAAAAGGLDSTPGSPDPTPDLVVVIPALDEKAPGEVQVFLNNGNNADDQWLGFDAGAPISVGANPTDVAAADLDDDTDVDLAVTNAFDGTVTILANAGTGNGAFMQVAEFFVGLEPSSILAEAFEPPPSDIKLAVALEGQDQVVIVSADGVIEQVLDTAGERPLELAAGAFIDDKDDCLDLAGVNNVIGAAPGPGPAPGSVFVFPNDGGTFGAAVVTEIGVDPRDVAVGDFDADGLDDIAAANAGDGTVSILTSNGDGTFTPRGALPVGADTRSVHADDLDGDGDPDLGVVADTGVVYVLRNIGERPGDLAFDPPAPFAVSDNPEFIPEPNFVIAADLDGMQAADLITVNEDAATVTGGSVSALLPRTCAADVDVDGTVGAGDFDMVLDDWGTCPGEPDPCPADIDGDGVVGIIDLLLVLFNWGICP